MKANMIRQLVQQICMALSGASAEDSSFNIKAPLRHRALNEEIGSRFALSGLAVVSQTSYFTVDRVASTWRF